MSDNKTRVINEILRSIKGGVEISIHILPRASRCEIQGTHNNALKIKLTSPPVDGEANIQCCSFLAKQLGVAKGQVQIISGKNSRKKVLRIAGVNEEDVKKKLLLTG